MMSFLLSNKTELMVIIWSDIGWKFEMDIVHWKFQPSFLATWYFLSLFSMFWEKNLEILSISPLLIHVENNKLKISPQVIFEMIKEHWLSCIWVSFYDFSVWIPMPLMEMEALT